MWRDGNSIRLEEDRLVRQLVFIGRAWFLREMLGQQVAHGFDTGDHAVRMLARGILAGGGFYPSLAHGDEHVDRYLAAAKEIFPELAEAIDRDDVEQRIGGPVRHSGFARLA